LNIGHSSDPTAETGEQGVAVIGESPSCVTLQWSTSAGANPMMNAVVSFSKINRITFDGQNTASIGLQIPGGDFFQTANEATDDVFENVGYGVMCGNLGNACSELSLLRDQFIANVNAGAALKNQNAGDMWIWYGLFQNEGHSSDFWSAAVTNHPDNVAGGNFHVFNSLFQNSAAFDTFFVNVDFVDLFYNYSIGSPQFFGGGVPKVGPTVLVGNTVIQGSAANGPPVATTSLGPGVLLNNNFVSGTGATVPVASLGDSRFIGDVFAMNNQFTTGSVTTPCGAGAPVQSKTVCHEIGDSIGSASTIENEHPQPTLPPVPANNNRNIYEVGQSCDANETNCSGNYSSIQAAINAAESEGTTNPVVHIPAGFYKVSSSISVPADFAMQIIGDGINTQLSAQVGSTRTILVNGPSKATLRDMRIELVDGVNGIDITNADQAGGQIFMEQPIVQYAATNVFVDNISNTTVEMHDTQIQYSSTSGQVGVKTTGPGLVNLFAGETAGNYTDYTVSGAGNLEVVGVWHDIGGGPSTCQFASVTGSGSFTFAGSGLWVDTPPDGCSVPSIDIANFTGTANLSGLDWTQGTAGTDTVGVSGSASGGLVLAEGLVGFSGDNIWSDTTSPADFSAFLNPTVWNSVTQRGNDISESCRAVSCPPTGTFLNPVVNRLATTQPMVRSATAAGVEDLGLYRVMIEMGFGSGTYTNNGIHISP
jgi:hypothetical protein